MRNILGPLTPEQIRRRYESGRGQGEREGYSPWLKVREVKSHGMSYVQPGHVVKREHHLLSGIERSSFLSVERLRGVLDIREQYPLWPIETTVEIADELGLNHPRVPRSDALSLMTTDLVLTTNWAGREVVAVHVKPAHELSLLRNQEKLDIETEWWRRRGAKLRVVSELEITKPIADNLDKLASHRSIDQASAGTMPLNRIADALQAAIRRYPAKPANLLANDVDRALGLEDGVCLSVFWHLVATDRLRIDLRQVFIASKPFAVRLLPEA